MNKQTKKLLKIALGGALLIAVFLVLMFLSTNKSAIDNSNISENEWIKGNPDAQVTIVEYSDFECPACAARQPFVNEIMQEFGDHVRLIYRHFPLRSIHANAQMAAQAAEAAGQQGQFWEMHDIIFANQSSWASQSQSAAENTFKIYAGQLGLDADQFSDYLKSSEAQSTVNDHVKAGMAAGVMGTPTFFLNGQQINFYDYETTRQQLREAIESAK